MKRRSFLVLLASVFGLSARAEVIDNGPPVDNGPKPSTPKVVPKAKPGIPYDGDHRCDNCGHQSAAGTGTWIVRGSAPGGAHTHQCPKCGQVWQHGGSGHVLGSHTHEPQGIQYTLPGTSSGCENGQCPTSVRRGFFRR